MRCFDVTAFHRKCPSVTLVSGPSGIYAWCPDCRIAAELESVSAKVAVGTACMAEAEVFEKVGTLRPTIGKMSVGVIRPEVVE